LTELARLTQASIPVVSVYLDARWTDEHQRDRMRIFLKNELAGARAAGGGAAASADLDWVESQGHALTDQAGPSGADAVVLFACEALGLREIIRVRVPLPHRFVVAGTVFLAPLASAIQQARPAVVAFVDTESARLVPLSLHGAGEHMVLESTGPDRQGHGDWAQMAQSRHQRQVQDHRGRHFEAVGKALGALVEAHKVERVVMAGEPENVAAFRKSLPPRIAALVVGAVAGARHEPADRMVGRAAELLDRFERQRQAEEVDAALTEAAKSKQVVAGLDEALEAVNRGAVHRLYLHRAFGEAGRICPGCGALWMGGQARCSRCGGVTTTGDLGPAMAARVVAARGTVEVVDLHQALADVGGVAALLRYPL
jgi:hypothetical protein